MWCFENYKAKTRFGEVHLSRILASWRNACGDTPEYCADNTDFMEWCRDELQMSEDDIKNAIELSSNGKLELERSATEYRRKVDYL